MKKQDLQKLIREELHKALNESKDYPEILKTGTKVEVNGKKGKITGNFMNRGDEYASYKITLDSGETIEISTADKGIKKLEENTPIRFPEVVPNGTIIYVDGRKARVRANFVNRADGPSILFDYINDEGLRGETGTVSLNNPTIDQREVELEITDEINFEK